MQHEALSDAQIRTLAEEIRDGTIAAETDWVEWKRSIDFSTAGGRFPLAKNVLGMANRMPEIALRNLGGYGYIVAGAKRGSIVGVDPVDPAKLHDWIDPYIGATGPDWQPRYVTVDDKTLVVIEVAPPRPGDPIHTLRKECNSFQRGTIFARKNGKTHQADDQDVANLEQRARGARLDLSLMLIGPERMSWFDRAAVKAEITRIADRSRDAQLAHARNYSTAGGPHSAFAPAISRTMAAASMGERRSLDEYESEVGEWHSEWTHEAFQHWVESCMLAGHGVHSLRLHNLTDQNFAEVQVRLHIDGVQVEEELPTAAVELPRKPTPFGKGTSLFGIENFNRHLLMPIVDFATPFDQPEFSVTQLNGAVEVVWNAGHLRPMGSVDSAELCILVDAPQDSNHLPIAWSATSTSVNGVHQGVLEIPIAPHPTHLDDIDHDLRD